MQRLPVLLAFFLLLACGPALACGPETDCVVGDRTYRIRLPPAEPGRRVGAILFVHGHLGHAADIMEDAELAQAVSGLGLALVAPQSAGPGWALPGSPQWRASDGLRELDAVERVLDDAIARFPIDPRRILASGMSAGGMLVWYLACHRADRFAGFAPISGTFWDPLPERCPTQPRLLRHIHGTADTVVPLAGRRVQRSRQGDVAAAIALFTAQGFGPPRTERADGLDCTIRMNARGDEVSLCLHDGGHDYRVPDLVGAWHALAARPAP